MHRQRSSSESGDARVTSDDVARAHSCAKGNASAGCRKWLSGTKDPATTHNSPARLTRTADSTRCPARNCSTAMTEVSPGTRVQYSDGRQGVVRFIGTTHFSTGQWIGIELDDDTGKNDGSVQGQRYFDCSPGRGIFVRPDTVAKTLERAPSFASGMMVDKPVEGAAPKTRQSIISAETARRRQSLMGSGASRSTPSSRQSLRVSHDMLRTKNATHSTFSLRQSLLRK
jgi:CAP-Gly domain